MNQTPPDLGIVSEVEESVFRVARLHPDLPTQDVILAILFIHAAKAVNDVVNRLLRPYDLTRVSFSTLTAMYGPAGLRVNPSILCEVTAETRTNMTRILDDLVARGLVSRTPNPEDRRRVDLSLTARGEALVEDLFPAIWETLRAMHGAFTPEEKKTLEGFLKRQLAAANALR